MSSKAAEPEEQEFDLETWLNEGFKGLRRTLQGKRRPPMLPEQFREHTRAARKELLLAVRSLLDAHIEESEEEAKPPKTA